MARGPVVAGAGSCSATGEPGPRRKGDAMRTSWLSLVGSVILVLLGGSSVAVVAQDEEPAPITFVTGTVA